MRLLHYRVLLIVAIGFYAFASGLPAQEKSVEIKMDQQVPMRDGVQLSVMVWKPANQQKPLPVIFVLTPYIASEEHERAVTFARSGYVYVSVDRRGRGNAQGEFNPLEDSGGCPYGNHQGSHGRIASEFVGDTHSA